jgi:hypothetical protein
MSAEESVRTGEFDQKTLDDAEYCRSKCKICVRARKKEHGLLQWILQKVEGSCEKCRAFETVYGVPAHHRPAG